MCSCDITSVSIVTPHQLIPVSGAADGNLLWLHYTHRFWFLSKLLCRMHERVQEQQSMLMSGSLRTRIISSLSTFYLGYFWIIKSSVGITLDCGIIQKSIAEREAAMAVWTEMDEWLFGKSCVWGNSMNWDLVEGA